MNDNSLLCFSFFVQYLRKNYISISEIDRIDISVSILYTYHSFTAIWKLLFTAMSSGYSQSAIATCYFVSVA